MARRNEDLANWEPTNMFGGEFTPFRDIWQTLAGDLGITTKVMRKNSAMEQGLMDQMAAESGRQLEAAAANANTEIDKQQFADLERQRQQYVTMTRSQDQEIRRAGLKGLSTLATGNLLEDIESRAEVIQDARTAEEAQVRGVMRQAMVNQAEELRKKGAALFETQRSRTEQFAQANRLLSDPNFDPNNALNQGALGELLQLSKRDILANAEDMADALGAAGGAPIIGSVIAVLAGALKADDMKFSKEDWRRIFSAAQETTFESFKQQLDFYQSEAGALREAGQPLGLSVDYDSESGQFTYSLEDVAQLGEGSGIVKHIDPASGAYPEFQETDPVTGEPMPEPAPLREPGPNESRAMPYLERFFEWFDDAVGPAPWEDTPDPQTPVEPIAAMRFRDEFALAAAGPQSAFVDQGQYFVRARERRRRREQRLQSAVFGGTNAE